MMNRSTYAALALVLATANLAMAQTTGHIDSAGREWMRIDETFSFAGSLPARCDPACSGIVTMYRYDVRTNAYTNPQQISLQGWVWADKDETQALMDEVGILSLGTSYMFVTTYSYAAGVHANTSTLDAESGQYWIGYAYEGHNMVSFDYGQAIVLPGTTTWSGPRGAFLYRDGVQPQRCVFGGVELEPGTAFTAYQTATVAWNQACEGQSEVRTCGADGVLSGSYTQLTCTVTPPLDCTFNGQTVPHGQQVTGYTAPTAASLGSYGTFCSNYRTVRTCTNGSFGVTLYPTCTQTVLDPKRCRVRDGVIKCKS